MIQQVKSPNAGHFRDAPHSQSVGQ